MIFMIVVIETLHITQESIPPLCLDCDLFDFYDCGD
jgi:hypothetical protein